MILAREGNDTVRGLGASDLLCGGTGNDTLTGGVEADHFGGGSGTDTATDFNSSQGDTKAGIP
jgi:Ca2+-binding RTX toxin-like protein